MSPRSKSPVESSFTFHSSTASNTKNKSSAETSMEESNAEEDEVQKHRVCLLGDNDVGKTSLVNQFLSSDYMNTYDASLGITHEFVLYEPLSKYLFSR